MSELPTVNAPEIKFFECKFTVESDSGEGGDWAKNVGGLHERKRISFEGCASKELFAALVDAVGKVVNG